MKVSILYFMYNFMKWFTIIFGIIFVLVATYAILFDLNIH